MISVSQPVVGKHMSVKPAVRKTLEAGGEERRREGRRRGKRTEEMRKIKK